ncbi:MAG: hypothetical protein ACR2I0_11850, partial [Rhodoferax sp.]
MALPDGGNVSALAELAGRLAVGARNAVYLLDALKDSLVSSEAGLDHGAIANPVVAMASNGSRWAFLCTTDGLVYQGSLLDDLGAVQWSLLTFVSDPTPGSCNSLSVVKPASDQSQWALVMASDAGGWVSSVFDDSPAALPNLLPGTVFPMTNHVNAAIQADVANVSTLLWATEFGVYGNAASDILQWVRPPLPVARNGPSDAAAVGQRLENVNANDVVAIGANLYAMIQSGGRPSYGDVMRSTDGGAHWTALGMTTDYYFSGSIRRMRSMAVDAVDQVLYVATDQGVFAFREADQTWTAVGNPCDARALAVGAKALYVGRDATTVDEFGSVHLLAGGGLVVHSLLGKQAFSIASEAMPSLPVNLSVRALVVDAGLVYAGGGILQSANSEFDNAVYVARDLDPGSAVPNWSRFGSGPIASQRQSILSRMAVTGGQVFAGGDGFLRQCPKADAAWFEVPGLPLLSNGAAESVAGLASDGTMLYVAVNGAGLLAWKIGSTFSMQAVNANVAATA